MGEEGFRSAVSLIFTFDSQSEPYFCQLPLTGSEFENPSCHLEIFVEYYLSLVKAWYHLY